MDKDHEALADAYERGLAAEAAGDRDAAEAAFAEALRLDPHDHGGVAVRLAAMGLAPAPETAPPAYVATLFDQHAEVFDGILVDRLGYHAPMLLREVLQTDGLGPFARLLDLGCGTGLCGEALEDFAAHRTGVDLSEGMLAVADEKEVYDSLFVGDAVRFLNEAVETWDLIVATDVLPYLGGVEALAAGVAQRLSSGGLFAFTTEAAAEDDAGARGWRIGAKRRYAHADSYLRRVFGEVGLTFLRMDPIVVRYDEGKPVPGSLAIAQAE